MNNTDMEIWDSLNKTQSIAVLLIKQAISTHRLSHAYLLSGGTKEIKYKLAYIFSKTLLCVQENICNDCVNCGLFNKIWQHNLENKTEEIPNLTGIHPDLKIYTGQGTSNQIKIENIRDLISQSLQPPFQSLYQIFIIYGADNMTVEAANAFLKTLEEAPNSTIYLLFADTLENLLPTIISRCQLIPLRTYNISQKDTELPAYLIPPDENLSVLKIFIFISGWLDILKDSEKKENLTLYLRQLQEKYWNKIKKSVLKNAKSIDLTPLEAIESAIVMLNHHVDPKLVLENCFWKILLRKTIQ